MCSFLGIRVGTFSGGGGSISENVAVEFLVLFRENIAASFIFCSSGLYSIFITVIISTYLLAETLIYVSSLIFVSDIFVKPVYHRCSCCSQLS